jgi:GntR family transcriptional repressor for pyruvate dehydrogenase complex
LGDKIRYSPVKRQRRFSSQVADQIQHLILNKRLNVGDKLPSERELCDEFGVSRTVVREAIRVLEAKGLLAAYDGSGTYVKSLESRDVASSIGLYIRTQEEPLSHEKLIEVRRVLEVPIAALVAERATEETCDELERLIAEMFAARHDPAAFARHDLEFHTALARATGNELFEILLDPFIDALYAVRRLVSTLEGIPEEAIQHHRNILECIRSGDPEKAEQAMSAHLDQSSRAIELALARQSTSESRLENG